MRLGEIVRSGWFSVLAVALIMTSIAVSLSRDPYSQRPFMRVESITVEDGIVTAVRDILAQGDPIVADWTVVVVPVNAQEPICQTVSGPVLNQGWSIYRQLAPREVTMSLDDWVGHPGCWVGLSNGLHDMFITWSPRGEYAPVRHHIQFYVQQEN